LAARYRIVGLIGEGGMGEVYRADDLKLGQPVALKFLPRELERNNERLERFVNEVKIGRRIAHPNVCRIYDIAEAEGHHFLCMEYVDGEDLASLLRRIGRLPKDKAVQIAWQLCTGLAAAHELGILHRDLKPANLMIDGRGRVRITDFGLAALIVEDTSEIAGTPAYMAPEQATGRASIHSDIYSLGLVLYEVFTGRHAFDGRAPVDVVRRDSVSTPINPATYVDSLDPTVERTILQCLEQEPVQRPTSALAVAAALPGADPLAAALTAGETPSPEAVANAGDTQQVNPWAASASLLAVVLGLGLVATLSAGTQLTRIVSLPKSTEVLADRAKELVVRLGYTTPPRDVAYGFAYDPAQLAFIEADDLSPERWSRLGHSGPYPIYFWYRVAPGLPFSSTQEGDSGDWRRFRHSSS
jgi:serine/threonine-protein kinase